MNKSESIIEISKALIDFQGKIAKISGTRENPFYKSKYVPLPTIIEAIKTPLQECGLSYSQLPDGQGLTTIIMHKSGEFIESTYELSPAKNDPQGWGAAITYARRYMLTSMLGLNTDADDDGNQATVNSEYQQLIKHIVDNAKTRDDLADAFQIIRSQHGFKEIQNLFKEKGEELKRG